VQAAGLGGIISGGNLQMLHGETGLRARGWKKARGFRNSPAWPESTRAHHQEWLLLCIQDY